mmetsp:Transcript_15261/g.17775  ORF Transcript_15261/g.17775 Transcript_15261/m.17775 type:complete len:263 (+) Transcript_15261:84-872(+)
MRPNYINISLIGKPGSGKGTYGSKLAETLKSPLVVMGDVLRNHVQQKTEIGIDIAEHQSQGKLVDDVLVSKALFSHLKQLRNERFHDKRSDKSNKFGFILDGFPRTLAQARLLQNQNEIPGANNDLMSKIEWPEEFQMSFAVSIDVPDEICVSKMLGRRKCSKCNKSFNISDVNTSDGFFMPPQLPDPYPCVKCDMEKDWLKRDDDTEEIFMRRMDEFYAISFPVTQFYASLDKLLSFVPYKGVKDIVKLEEMVIAKATSIK